MIQRKVPSYRHHKARNLAKVVIDGKDIYLGTYGSPESWEKYHRIVAELFQGPKVPPSTVLSGGLTVAELILAYMDHVRVYYIKNGRPTEEQNNIAHALRPLKALYAHSLADDFGPKSLKAVRQAMIDGGWCRKVVNKNVGRVRRLFRWGVENELVKGDVFHALMAVTGLKAGRSAVRESTPVGPAPEAHVEAALREMKPQVRDMVRLQLLTGARPTEVCTIRPSDIDRSGKLWIYRPREHKSEHHGKVREIVLGPKAQAVLAPWLDRGPDAYCFSPQELVAAISANAKKSKTLKKTKKKTTSKPPRKRRPIRVADHYDHRAYRHAVHRACDRAKVEHWSPNQLRHLRATQIRSLYGLEAAQIVLGHSKADVTQVYAEANVGRAAAIMAEVG